MKEKIERQAGEAAASAQRSRGDQGIGFQDCRPTTPLQRRLSEGMRAENRTGMPDQLKSGVESLSGMDLSDVRVHRNSARPAQLNALAYAQGNDIHLGPGQERHLPHEAWHVVQQRQGRVRPTMQMAGTQINDDPSLEMEADVMGIRAVSQLMRSHVAASLGVPRVAGAGYYPIQLVRAYRVGTSASKYKISVSDGRITEFQGGSSGIDISFGSSFHAEYYFGTKKGDDGTEMVAWDFPDPFYEMILHRMHKADKGKNWDQNNMWKAIWNLKAPVNSSDTIVTKNALIAPHFSNVWIEPLNRYGKGSNAVVTTYSDFFADEEEEVSSEPEVVTFEDDELVFMYKVGQEDSGVVIEYRDHEGMFNGDEAEWRYASKTVAIENEWATEEDFAEL